MTLSDRNPQPITIREFVQGIGKFKALSDEYICAVQDMVGDRFAMLQKLAGLGT